MIKENMVQERVRDREFIEFLKSQIVFSKEEFRQKKISYRKIAICKQYRGRMWKPVIFILLIE